MSGNVHRVYNFNPGPAALPLEVLCLHRIGRQGLSCAVAEVMLLAPTSSTSASPA